MQNDLTTHCGNCTDYILVNVVIGTKNTGRASEESASAKMKGNRRFVKP